ncbi:MAG: hypothetical protein LBG95_04960 [Treponema sp.]|jgi:hypothetical protein|nr:hypothetical protein [Treponema sp.]
MFPWRGRASNMIPAKLAGKPFWDLYLYNDPPIWLAYINCVKHFGFDSLMDGYVNISFDDLDPPDGKTTAIVYRSPERIVAQSYKEANGKKFWDDWVTVFYIADPPILVFLTISISIYRNHIWTPPTY